MTTAAPPSLFADRVYRIGTEAAFADGDGDGDVDLFLAEGTKQYASDETLLGQGGVWMIPGE